MTEQTHDTNRLSARLFIRTSSSNRRRFKDWNGPNGATYATDYAECLPDQYEADLYTFNPETQRLTYTRTFHAEGA